MHRSIQGRCLLSFVFILTPRSHDPGRGALEKDTRIIRLRLDGQNDSRVPYLANMLKRLRRSANEGDRASSETA